jgi:predicted SnoaL-like aldol condensation-catalyzing enzyme
MKKWPAFEEEQMMRKLIWSLALVVGLTLGAPGAYRTAWADTPAASNPNLAAAADFMRLAFQEQNLRAAFDKYVAADLVEHDPYFGDGRESVFKYIEQRHTAHPNEYLPIAQWKTTVDYVALDGDMLITKMHVFSRKNDLGRVFADFWRFKDGKIVEHWDIIQEVPADKANPRDMW